MSDHTPDHYFSDDPSGDAPHEATTVRLAGRDVSVHTSAGVFSRGRVDTGTSVLLRTVPDPPPGCTLVDVGCGWGPIALTAALREPTARVWAVDTNPRAVQLTASNADALGLTGVTAGRVADVPDGLMFDRIWSNPPIRIGKAALHELLEYWLGRLAPDGEAWLVVQKNLGADSLTRWLDERVGAQRTCKKVASAKGFRVLRVGLGDESVASDQLGA